MAFPPLSVGSTKQRLRCQSILLELRGHPGRVADGVAPARLTLGGKAVGSQHYTTRRKFVRRPPDGKAVVAVIDMLNEHTTPPDPTSGPHADPSLPAGHPAAVGLVEALIRLSGGAIALLCAARPPRRVYREHSPALHISAVRWPHFGEYGEFPVGSLPFHSPPEGDALRMTLPKYTPARRTWVRDILIGVAAGLGSDLVWNAVQAAAHLLG